MEKDTLTIRDLARTTGVSSKVLRYWESRGLLPKPGRTHTDYRLYPHCVVRRVQFILKAKSIGFTLSEIKWLFGVAKERGASCAAVNAWALRKLKALEHQIKVLTRLRNELRRHQQRWHGRLPCPPLSAEEICCLIEELPSVRTQIERR